MLTDLFGGPVSGAQVSFVALNAEIPWAGECLLGTKSLSWQKGANPERKHRDRDPRPHGSQRMSRAWGLVLFGLHTQPGAWCSSLSPWAQS